jgi:predicted ribosomally synthesized peptide with nif11-like leader
MADESLLAFAERIERDAALRAKLEAVEAPDEQSALAAVARIAADAGFAVSAQAIAEGVRQLSAGELGADELDSVTGGASLSSSTVPTRFAAVLHKVVPGWEPAGGINPCC